ncbi:conserved hypothetical protein [Aeromonas phage 65]|uniref:Uncharacterized protein n=2 Tax=Ishigurovirus osborne TaxID=260149 RepID=A0A219YCU7_9CAUD|nr:hypothetical protein ST65p411 [Aeromonas phage 65]ADQ53418.1 conserved hypothetical protein [Aeromonas phage 65]APU01775.1 hypothetical protein [Aeromonas phage 65.2]
MNIIKNEETENFCKSVADEYRNDILGANQMLKDFVAQNRNLRYWELLAINERIRYLIKHNPNLREGIILKPNELYTSNSKIRILKHKGK